MDDAHAHSVGPDMGPNCLQRLSALEGDSLMWMMPLHLHVNQKSDYDDQQTMKVAASKGRINLERSEVHKNVQHGKG